MAFDRRTFLLASGSAAIWAGAQLRLPAWAAEVAPELPRDVEQAIRSDLEDADVVAAAITVVQGGRLRAFIPYGKASIPFDAPVTSRTLFHTGSVGKHATAIAVLQCVEAGHLKLDDPIGYILKGLPEWIAAIPTRHLLNHTSGIPEYAGADAFSWDRPWARDAFVGTLKQPDFAPGEAWSYSNSAYMLLGYAIEAVSGLSYPDFVIQRLLKPAGTPLARPDVAGEPIIGRAEPYVREDGQTRHAVRMDSGVSASPDGGLLFSPIDWAPWQQALAQGRLLGRAATQEMFAASTLASGVTTGYGLGWFIDITRGQPVYYHSGGVPGFSAYLQYYPAQDLMAVGTFTSSPRRPLRGLIERVIDAVYPNLTSSSLAEAEQTEQREKRLQAFFNGETGDHLLCPNLSVTERITGRPPTRRLRGKPDSVEFLESHSVAGGEVARYRITIEGVPRTNQIGWTPDDRIFLFR